MLKMAEKKECNTVEYSENGILLSNKSELVIHTTKWMSLKSTV